MSYKRSKRKAEEIFGQGVPPVRVRSETFESGWRSGGCSTSASEGHYAIIAGIVHAVKGAREPLVPLPAASAANWLDAAIDKLRGFRCLKPGWNGYSAPPPSDLALASAEDFLLDLYDHELEPGRVAASAAGGVGITFRNNGRKAYVEIFSDADAFLLLSDEGHEEVSRVELGGEAISRIREYLDYA
jgi:hypothetical protein